MIESEHWGKKNGRRVFLYTLSSDNGSKMTLTNYGARITSLVVPGENGEPIDVVLGFDNPEDYFNDGAYFGAIVGRYANRISKGEFSLGPTDYSLSQNDGLHHLHGGYRGFHSRIWKNSSKDNNREPEIKLEYLSEDGEEGYPGNLKVSVSYKLTQTKEVKIQITAIADRATIANISNHNYYNLSGGKEKINDHELKIRAEKFTPTDQQGIPSGELLPVEGTPFDFREPEIIGEKINTYSQQLRNKGGYDHNFVLKGQESGKKSAAEVYSPSTGLSLKLKTNQPGLQFYTGNFLEENLKGKKGARYGPRYGLCLEPQIFPDSPNHSKFPSAVVKPGKPYEHTIVLDFKTEP